MQQGSERDSSGRIPSERCASILKANFVRCEGCLVAGFRLPASSMHLHTLAVCVARQSSSTLYFVCGQRQRCPSVTGALYALFLEDEFSRYVWDDTLPNKSDATATTVDTLKLIQNELGLTVRRFHSDGGSEFVN